MVTARDLPEMAIFDELIAKPENMFVKRAVDAGRIPVGYNCYITPEPLLMVGKLFPVRMRAPGLTDTAQSNYYMSLIACSYARAILEAVLGGQYNFLRALISGGSCIQITRTAQHSDYVNPFMERIERGDFIFYTLDSPRKISDGTMGLYLDDLKRAAGKLSRMFGVEYTDTALRAAIRELNSHRALLRRVSDFRKGKEPKITGTEYHKLVVACLTCPKDMLKKPLEALVGALEKREPVTGYSARVMVAGPVFDNPAYTRLIEEQGALVVCDRCCHGSIPGLEPIPEDGDPWETLAEYYADTCECTRMMGWADKRYEQKRRYIDEFGVDGVIMHYIKFCDLWAYEVPMTIERFRAEGIPVMKLEHEYAYSNEGQIKTRVQAFIEQIENKQLMLDDR